MAQPRIEMVEPSTPDDQIDGILKRDGCVVIHDLVEPAALDALFAELGPWLERAKVSTGDFTGKNTKRMHGLVAKSPMVGEMLTHPKVTAIVDRMLGPWCDTFQLQACSTTSIGPGARPQPLHRDDLLYPFKHPMERNACCTFFWALTDFTKENGATRIVPRSQAWDDEREPREEETVQAVMPRGSVACFTGATYHGGSANTTKDEWRHAMFAGYTLGWLRQEENQYLVCPPHVAKDMPEKVQRLIGYQMHNPFLGWYDLQDPIVALHDYEELSSGGHDLVAEGVPVAAQAGRVKRA